MRHSASSNLLSTVALLVLFAMLETGPVPTRIDVVVDLGLGSLLLFLGQLSRGIHVHVKNKFQPFGSRV
jgi:hypothetical protein